MRWSQLYVPTLREDPAEAEAASHRLLIRAGYVRQLMAGHYSLLPLAVRVRAKIMDIIREELGRIGAQEFVLPVMHPAELWQQSGRWEAMGDEMFRLRDRRGADLALGMTHEEVVTALGRELRSYRELPQIWYQFQTKLRDEPRPRSGLLRVREFTMKDSYSFDADASGLDHSFMLHHGAYQRIFTRIGIAATPVRASSGSMGGTGSVEFMCPADAGEDLVVRCVECDYAANVEKAVSALAPVDDGPGAAEPERFDTPGARTIDDLVTRHEVPADRQVKTLVYMLGDQLTLVLLRGDHNLVEQKLIDATGANRLRPAAVEEIQAALHASPGSLGAVGVGDLPVIADEALAGRRNLTTGANADGVHLRGVDMDRDITVTSWADLREVTAGERCADCGGELEVIRAIEVGHIFKLGRKYTDPLGVSVLDPDGNRLVPLMGCYGIGVERALASVVEVHHDEKGIVWPVSVAPFEVAVLGLGGEQPARTAAEIYQRLRAEGVDALLDDRAERPGVRFSDIELVGIPFRVTIGSRGLAAGTVEITTRATGETQTVPLAEVVEQVRKRVLDNGA